jgi:hypothetical protein
MAEPLWGQLEKAQDDDETIEEAIARLIGVHEASAESHLGEGESLEAHKADDVLDHPAGSVLADKQTFTEIVAETDFESLTGWLQAGNFSYPVWPGVQMQAVATGPTVAYLKSEQVLVVNPYSFGKDIMLQWSAKLTNVNSTATLYLGLGGDPASGDFGFGFVWNGTNLKGYYKGEGGNTETSAITTSVTGTHTFRIYFEEATRQVHFYFDGVLGGSLDNDDDTFPDDANIFMYMTKGTSGTATFQIFRFTFAVPV